MSTEHQKLWVHGQSAACPLSLGNYTQQPLSPLAMPWCLKQEISKVIWWYVFSKEWRTKSILLVGPAIELPGYVKHRANWQNTKCYCLQPHRNSSLYWKSQASAIESAWSCAPLSLSENLQCMFPLMGGENLKDSEPCSPIH